MLESTKKFWRDHAVGHYLSIGAGITVMGTLVGALLLGIYYMFKTVLIATGLIWVLYGWVLGSFSYIAYAVVHDLREAKARESIDETCRRM